MTGRFLVAVSAGVLAIAMQAAVPASQASDPEWTAADCATCHQKAAQPAFARTAHANLDQSCESCHVGSGAHLAAQMEGDDSVPAPLLSALSVEASNATCLTCHENGNQASWLSSLHDRRKVACTSCHSVHDAKSPTALLKTRHDADTCYTCHKSNRSKSFRTSHHPVREGKMSCSSCHNVHDGDAPKMVKAASSNELCYQCHAEKRGPFLFEHAPVKDDCMSCHEPHGSNHNRLLTQKEPNLCWSCHFTGSGHFGSGDNFSTALGVPAAPPGAPSGFPTVNSRFIGRSCSKCHMNIHGSNSPSGAFFVR